MLLSPPLIAIATPILYTIGIVVVVVNTFILAVSIYTRLQTRKRRFHTATQATRGRKQIVILGGGFGGVYVAHHLEKLLGSRDDYEIVLVNKENYFVFQPMLPEVISGQIGILDTVSPIRLLLPSSDLHVRDIESIDLASRTVTLAPGFMPRPHVLKYDHLVIALGTVTDFRGMRGLPEHALPFKNLADALNLRNHVIRVLEEAAIEEDDPVLKKRLLTFAVAGGGFSGVEVVAELNDFVREIACSYRGIDPKEIRVVLIHGQERILPEVDEKLALFAQKKLVERGVELLLKKRLGACTSEAAVLGDGSRIETKTLVSTIPAMSNPIIDTLDLPKAKNGRITVDGYTQVQGSDHVWALGDCAIVPMPNGEPSPPTAQHAIRQAEVCAHNIVAAIRGGEKRKFEFTGLGKMGSLGHRSAVAEVFGFKISGLLAWFLWRTIYLMKLPGWHRRIKVAVSWTLDLFLPPESVQLKLSGSVGITQEHFEPGQEIFRQGDVGDRIYIVLSGEAEVVKEVNGQENALGRVAAGDYIGEMALLNQTVRSATVRCTKAMDALSLPKREFGLLTKNLPELRASFEAVMQKRLAGSKAMAAVAQAIASAGADRASPGEGSGPIPAGEQTATPGKQEVTAAK